MQALRRVGPVFCLSSIAIFFNQSAAAQDCEPRWTAGLFGEIAGLSGPAEAGVIFDDGMGAALYVGGNFLFAGTERVSNIARWDGVRWSAVGAGFNAPVRQLAVFDEGSGARLLAGGDFTASGTTTANRVARLNGTTWEPLGSGMNGPIYALKVHDDGNGAALYAGGSFTAADDLPANQIAKWNGSGWSALGGGLTDGLGVYALESFRPAGATQSLLVAGGQIARADGQPVNGIARWDGASWSAMGSGVNGTNFWPIRCLFSFDDGAGEALYVGGRFMSIDGVPAGSIARWDGVEWSGLGSALEFAGGAAEVCAITAFDDGAGMKLYIGGYIGESADGPLGSIVRWNGTAWERLHGGAPSNSVQTIIPFQSGANGSLFVGGNIAGHCRRWNASGWSELGGGTDGYVNALCSFADDSGTALYAGGAFGRVGDTEAKGIARWALDGWSPVTQGIWERWAYVSALQVHSIGGRPGLYVGGSFNVAGDVLAKSIAMWDGEAWHALGAGVDGTTMIPGRVMAMTTYDDGSGPALFVGGFFYRRFGGPGDQIAKWDGAFWYPLGDGLGDWPNSYVVQALAVYDDGSGPALYVGGDFEFAGATRVNSIARWNGSEWSALGSGIQSADEVYALATFTHDGEESLYVGGDFRNAGGVPANNIARWDGQAWSALGQGFGSPVYALHTHDDGDGAALFVSGGGRSIRKWSGTSWTTVGSFGSTGASVYAMTTHDDGAGAALFVGGSFETVGDELSNAVARWGRPYPRVGDLNGDCAVSVADLAILLSAFSACEGDAWFNAAADLDADGCVALADLALLLAEFGRG
jgi:hypothetical protein